jgi:hypothetical protein
LNNKNNKPELTREAFILNTKVFVSPSYFDMIQYEYNKGNINNPLAFCKQWTEQEQNQLMMEETYLSGKIRYMLDDESLTDIGGDKDIENLSAMDIIENLCSNIKHYHDLYFEKCNELKSLRIMLQKTQLTMKECVK